MYICTHTSICTSRDLIVVKDDLDEGQQDSPEPNSTRPSRFQTFSGAAEFRLVALDHTRKLPPGSEVPST